PAAWAAAARPAGLRVEVVAETGSTNVDVAGRARAGEPSGLVVAAERQHAGRGRMDRSWTSPPGGGLTVSLLTRPAVPMSRLGWLPMVTGTAIVGTLRARWAVPAWLKWPNDVQVDGEKLAGILAELVYTAPAVVPPGAGTGAARPGVVIGFGLNVHTRAAELPTGGTSLAELAARGAAAAVPSRTELLAALLTDLAAALAGFERDPAAARPAYRAVCATLGRHVRLDLPNGERVSGLAEDVDDSGRLVVAGHAYSAADVVHLRPSAP
ncbi:MAG: biotin--[acetyl-CoA-carboxylase] ligase, partial [Frankia sp.]|nr:biotin--[acetyl-CoA-carboxylase] ligase [Frankia sp.]